MLVANTFGTEGIGACEVGRVEGWARGVGASIETIRVLCGWICDVSILRVQATAV